MRMTGSPNPKAPGVAAGVTEPMIEKLVHTFYARVRRDPTQNPGARAQYVVRQIPHGDAASPGTAGHLRQ